MLLAVSFSPRRSPIWLVIYACGFGRFFTSFPWTHIAAQSLPYSTAPDFPVIFFQTMGLFAAPSKGPWVLLLYSRSLPAAATSSESTLGHGGT